MFNLQRFGSNDTITSSREGKLVVEFYDSDNRTVTFDNPRSDLTAADVNAVVNYMKTNQPVIGDKHGASIVGASSYKTVEKISTKLDLS